MINISIAFSSINLEQGVFDFKEFEKEKLEFKGSWKFYWKKFIDPQLILSGQIPKEDGLLSVPGSWAKGVLYDGRKTTPKGFGTYLLEIKNTKLGEKFNFYPGRLKQASHIYLINGGKSELIFKAGKPGKNQEEEIPQLLSSTDYKIEAKSQKMYLLVHSSNFGYRDGGFAIAPRFFSKSDSKKNYIKVFTSGLLFIMAIYHFGLVVRRRKDKAALYFGFICCFFFFRHSIISDHQYLFFDPSYWIHESSVKFEYFGLAILPFLFIAFLDEIFKNFFSRVYKVSLVITGILCFFVLFFTASFYTKLFVLIPLQLNAVFTILFCIYKFVILHIEKNNFAKYCLISMGILCIAVVMDILVTRNILTYEIKLTQFGFIIWIFSQSYILAVKFANAYDTAEMLSENLAKEVEIQTREAILARKRAEDSEREVASLIDNMRQSVFCIDRSLLISPPVSNFSKDIFGKNIEGLSIYDTLFADMDRKKEGFSRIETALAVLFNSDELQWLLMEDFFPRRVVLKDESKVKEKILKVAYTPLWNKEELLEKLMFVIEDITEIEKLEQKMKDQQNDVSKKAQIIQELAANKKEELQMYFDSVSKMSNNTIDIWKKIRGRFDGKTFPKEDMELVFRNLHTIKGNSQIYGFTGISQIAHHLENEFAKFKKENIFNKSELEFTSFLGSLYGLRGETNQYFILAKNLLGVESEDDSRFKNEIHDLLKDLEYWLGQIYFSSKMGPPPFWPLSFFLNVVDLDDDIKEQVFSSIKRVLHSMKGVARSMNENEFSENIHIFESTIYDVSVGINFSGGEVEENFKKPLKEITDVGRAMYLNSSLFKSHHHNDEARLKVLGGFLNLVNLFKKGDQNKRKELLHNLYTLNSQAGSLHLFYIPCILRSIYDLFDEDNQINNKKINVAFQRVWLHLKFLIQVDLEKKIPSSVRKKVRDLLSKESGKNWQEATTELKLNSEIPQDFLLLVLISNLMKENFSQNDFYEVIEFLEEGEENAVDSLVPTADISSLLNDLFSSLKKIYSVESIENIASINNVNSETLNNLVNILDGGQIGWFSYIESLDLMRILGGYINLEDEDDKNIRPEIVEVLVDNFNSIKGKIRTKIKSQDSITWDEMENHFESLMELPVKYSLKNLKSMVSEIGKGLGKKVRFVLKGDQGSLRKDDLNLLKDAMVHLVRNSVDHGIEVPSQRKENKKEEFGFIEINCFEDGDSKFNIEIKDDGKGLNKDLLVERAIDKNLVTEGDISKMNDEEKLGLIFLPNFSTKENVTEISGRGVGMDVVKKNIEQIGGSLSLESNEGKGTTFRIKLDKISS